MLERNIHFLGKFYGYKHSECRYDRPHCERHNGRQHLWAPMADHTASATMAGLTMSCGRHNGWLHLFLWESNGWPHGGFPFLWAPDVWPYLLLWAPDGWPHGGIPLLNQSSLCGRPMAGLSFSCGRLTAGCAEVPIPKYCPLCGHLMAGPSFSCRRLAAGRTEDPIPINFSFYADLPPSCPF